jgi:outer membrane protein assembly factor BamB
MRRTARCGAWLLAGVCLLWSGSVPAETVQPSAFASPELLDHAGLQVLWRATLPLLEKEDVDSLFVLGDSLYARSSHNYVWSLDRTTGSIVFARSIAEQNAPIMGWDLYGDRLFAVIGNQIVEFDKSTGLQLRASDPGVGVVAPVVRNRDFFYVPSGDRRIHAFRSRNAVHVFDGGTRSDSMVTSVVADNDMVVLGTESGRLTGMDTDEPRIRWEFTATGPLAGPMIRDGHSLYVSSRDTGVYRIDMLGASHVEMIWRYQADAILDREPRVAVRAVYQYALYRNLTAIDKERGTALWTMPDGLDLLAESGDRAYVLTKNKSLAVMDSATGKCVCCANVGPIAKYATNVADAKIYIADDHGHVVCLQPRK